MGSDEEDHPTAVYGEEDIDEEDDEESEEEEHTLQNRHVDEDDVDLIDVMEDDEEEDDSMSSAAGEVTIAVAGIPNVTTTVAATPTTATTTTTSLVRSDAIVEVKKPVALDDSRRLFQRLWNDEDEIELLQGFLDYTTQRGTNNSSHHHHDTAAFYDQIKGKLQLDFNKNQLVEKLRRLKKKYRNVLSKISSGKEYVFKSPHDQATFDLSCKIWSGIAATTVSTPATADGGGIDDDEPHNPNPNPNFTFNLNEHNGNDIADPNSSEKKVPRPRKRSRSSAVKIEENFNQQHQFSQSMGAGAGAGAVAGASNPAIPNVVEETVKSCLLPLFKELVNNSPNGPCGNSRGLGLGLGGMNMNPFGGSMNFSIGDMTDDKWRKQHILELEVYSKRLELMQDQIKSRLEELRSMGS
ncbi:probable transcription factor At3g04930 [Cynara cardunculus var. scolymus]|uniref:Glabrous enhancer-binding protein-like DBD domain-containing protein n=1 Tax=Cynara cardunculus var. scolymus TaxID=59895 RepID=A0A118K252_CYNCS|nr:probable transcription factor At3g04930 [Cynara cardunculus var. scolymus]KVI03828.1 Protein of unknown function DUF573 [Cynara cardunculus var. scolymus]